MNTVNENHINPALSGTAANDNVFSASVETNNVRTDPNENLCSLSALFSSTALSVAQSLVDFTNHLQHKDRKIQNVSNILVETKSKIMQYTARLEELQKKDKRLHEQDEDLKKQKISILRLMQDAVASLENENEEPVATTSALTDQHITKRKVCEEIDTVSVNLPKKHRQESEALPDSSECDDVVILPTPQKPAPPIITLDDETDTRLNLSLYKASTSTEYPEKVVKPDINFTKMLGSTLLLFVEKPQKFQECSVLHEIAQAVLTLSYIFRIKYRLEYNKEHSKLIDRQYFSAFCEDFKQFGNLPFVFTFLLNASLKFEYFLYLHREGYDYFDIFVNTLQCHLDRLCFISSVEKLSEISQIILQFSKDLQILVNYENPCVRVLPTFQQSIYDIETNYPELSNKESFSCLQAIRGKLYSGLQEYVDNTVLPLIMLRFMLNGEVPGCDPPVLGFDDKTSIESYFNRCLAPELISGAAYRERTITYDVSSQYLPLLN